jgi:hypothetical protein
MGLVHLELHYRVDPLLELNSLKDPMDNFSRNVDFLNHKSRRTFVVFSTTNFLSEDLRHLLSNRLEECPFELVVHEGWLQSNCMYL